ncbi:hypothetical protein Tco_1393504 [Tanacetum coccineum]
MSSDSASSEVTYTPNSYAWRPASLGCDFFRLQELDSPGCTGITGLRTVEDQPYVVADSPIALSPGYVADSDPEEDPEEDSEDGPVDYPADGGDGDDDDSSNDDEEEKEASEEEEEEHLAPADSVVAPVVDHVPSSEETEPFETDESAATPPSPPACRTTARISIRPEAPMPFPSEEEVERLLALPPPSPSPLILLSPPSVEERLARCLVAPPHPSPPLPPPPSSLHLPPYVPTSLPLPSSPLPPLPALLFIPPLVDRREDTPEAELPPRKRLCLTALTSRYEVGESSTAIPRPAGGVKDKILATSSKTPKVENAPAEMLRDMDQQMEKRPDDVKPRRVRAMAMTIQYRVRGMILAAQNEAFKQENVPLVGTKMDEAHASSKEWSSGVDHLRLRWEIYFVVLADAAESIKNTTR